jgi:hypothetical protein
VLIGSDIAMMSALTEYDRPLYGTSLPLASASATRSTFSRIAASSNVFRLVSWWLRMICPSVFPLRARVPDFLSDFSQHVAA